MGTPDSRTHDEAFPAAALRVLIVDDNKMVATVFAEALNDAGMLTRVAMTGAQAIAAQAEFRPDIALVDLGLPDIDGMQLVARFVREAVCGVIVITGNATEATLVAGLDTGADDYIVKPASMAEIIARIRAVQRRLSRAGPEPAVLVPTLTFDPARRRLTGPSDSAVTLSEEETALLDALLESDGASVSREALIRTALERRLHDDDGSLDRLVSALRGKLAALGGSERSVLSAGRYGYLIAEPGQFVVLAGGEESKTGQGAALDPPGGGGPLDPII